MYLRIVDHDIKAQMLHRQAADGRQQRIGSHNTIMLSRDQSDARIDQFLLRVEDVKSGSLPDARLFAHAVQRDLCGVYLGRRCFDLRFSGTSSCPQLCTTVARA